MNEQLELNCPETASDSYRTWLEWREREGANMVMERFFRISAGYSRRWLAKGITVSATLIFEIVRDYYKTHRVECGKQNGYRMPNVIRPYLARFVLDRRPDWKGLFQTAELKKRKKLVREISVKEFANG